LHVLFVCTGNICRSPTAERLAAAFGHEYQLADFTTSSAGVRAVVGHPIHPEATRVLESLGGDASQFAARQFTPKVASDADLVITMTAAHRDAVLKRAPRLLRITFTLSEAAELASDGGMATIADLPELRARHGVSNFTDVTDPIGQDPDVFDAVGAQIALLLPPIVDLCRRSDIP
jgi:protein-tyrosine phosphatase